MEQPIPSNTTQAQPTPQVVVSSTAVGNPPSNNFSLKRLIFAFFYAIITLLALQGLSFLTLKYSTIYSLYNLGMYGYTILSLATYFFAGLSIGKIMGKGGWLYGGIWGLLVVIFIVGSEFIAKSQAQAAGINSGTISYNLDFNHLFSLGLIVVIVLPLMGGLLGSYWAKLKDDQVSDSASKTSALSIILFIVLLLAAIFGGYINIVNSFYTNLPTSFSSLSKTSQSSPSITQTGPGTFSAKVNNIVRKSDLANISQLIKSYADTHGGYPSEITTIPQKIAKNDLDVCKYSTQTISMINMPTDPSLCKTNQSSYQKCDSNYDTGYTIVKNPDGTITLSAPLAELHEKISVNQ